MGALSLLVTGAAGYVGRATVEEARARGHRVVALVRRDRGVGFGEGVETRVADLVDGLSAEAKAALLKSL
ncbi:MAG TPA: NAD-dependent epimerase/dehydratase family protein [Polyangiaceae bacterium LLY-WYZ-15_(1-7)]|nr:NAD-dependent epimerase/dehydratase family protein [Polyangiaceae bacterium LLY-WYZ-15_(1-7)]